MATLSRSTPAGNAGPRKVRARVQGNPTPSATSAPIRGHTVRPVERDWWGCREAVVLALPALTAHARGWVAEATRLADAEHAADPETSNGWPSGVPAALGAAKFVLTTVLGILNGSVSDWWGNAPVGCVFPLVPLLEPDPAALPDGWDARCDKLADLMSLLDDVAWNIQRCMHGHRHLTKTDPLRESLLETLGGGWLALKAAIDLALCDLEAVAEAAAARRKVARLRLARKMRAADGPWPTRAAAPMDCDIAKL